jgi:hypothetical protein
MRRKPARHRDCGEYRTGHHLRRDASATEEEMMAPPDDPLACDERHTLVESEHCYCVSFRAFLYSRVDEV